MESKTLQFGPWAVVTGANSGIGAAFAEELAKQGYNVALVGCRAEALDAVSNRLTKTYSINTRSVVVDLSTPDFLEHFSIRLGVARVCEISFAFFFGNPFEKGGDCCPKLLNSARLHFA
jgi:short-subunit dehydrogenase